MLHAHVQSFWQMLALMRLLVRFPGFRPPKIKFMNVEMTQQKRERSERTKTLELFDFVCQVS